jgi:hypothetical protein
MSATRIVWNEALGKHRYRGAAFGWIFVAFAGCMNTFRGSVHLFTHDGGAGRIAGIDLSQGGEVILTLFAGAGLTQLLTAVVDFAVAFRFRALVPAACVYHLLHLFGSAVIVWLWRPLAVPAPGKFGMLILTPIAAIALWAALRKPREVPSRGAASAI